MICLALICAIDGVSSTALVPAQAGSELRTRHSNVTSQPMGGGFREWHNAIALAFAETDGEPLRGRVDVVEVQTMRFDSQQKAAKEGKTS